MPRTIFKELASNLRRRLRTFIYLTPPELTILDELAAVQQELLIQEFERTRPRPVKPPFTQESWYQHPVGYDAFMRLRGDKTFSPEAFEKTFHDWWDAKREPGRPRNMQTQFPPSHCSGVVIGKLLEKHGQDLLREMQHGTKTKDTNKTVL